MSRKKVPFEINRMFAVATNHITQDDNIRLSEICDSEENPLSFTINRHTYGFFISISENMFTKSGQVKKFDDSSINAGEEVLEDFNLSKNFLDLLKTSVRQKCLYLLISQDGPSYPQLPYFEW